MSTPFKIIPTPEQQAVIDAIPDPRSQMIEAMAGTAKTTTLRLAAQRVRKPALALAFNKKIALELKETMPGNFTCLSLNAHGFGALRRSRPRISKWDVDGQKLGKVIKLVCAAQGIKLAGEQWDQLRKLVQGAMGLGMVPRGMGEGLAEDSPETWDLVAEKFWIPQEDKAGLIDLARDVLGENLARIEQGQISFDDQVYGPLVLPDIQWPKYPVLFGDEVQDWNLLNHAMVERSLAPGAKLVLAGDSRQAIYAFRGAAGDSMALARRLAPEWIDQTLTLTFRCPKAIVGRQQEHAPGYTAAEGNVEGRVVQLPGSAYEDGDGQFDSWDIDGLLNLSPLSSPPVVLCRNNAPLLSLAFKLIRQRVSVAMLGRDIGKGLVALSKKIAKADDLPAAEVYEAVKAWKEKEVEMLRLNDAEESKIDSVHDRAECLLAVLSSAGVETAGALRAALEDLFSRESGRVQLATIHRAKGLEWPTVLHLDPWRIPSKQAQKAGGVALEQELNLRYVCETRARETLVLASLEDFE